MILGIELDARPAAGKIGPVDEDSADDFAERQRDDGEIVAAQPQHGKAENHAPYRRQDAGERQADPKRKMKGGRQQRVGIGADRVERDIAEIEQAGEANDDIQAPAEHHIDQDLDAVAVDPFQRTGVAERGQHHERIGDEEAEPDQRQIGHEAFLRVRLGLGDCGRLGVGTRIGEDRESADCRNSAEGHNHIGPPDQVKHAVVVRLGVEQNDRDTEQLG